jgi:GDPmannose 4,6-dehydratase
MWLMLQHDKPDDFVIATGQSCSIRSLLKMAFNEVGINIAFKGQGINEEVIVDSIFETSYKVAANLKQGQVVVKIDPAYFRPSDVNTLMGDASKAHLSLGWKPQYTVQDIVSEMIMSDCKN